MTEHCCKEGVAGEGAGTRGGHTQPPQGKLLEASLGLQRMDWKQRDPSSGSITEPYAAVLDGMHPGSPRGDRRF